MKRILFVDDEPAMLEGLRSRLRVLRSRWIMLFAGSGEEAMTQMEQEPVDVIVTDMRMPGMDGADLLRRVCARWPETIRIVLSGFAQEEQSARLLTVAHQYLSKPCDALQIENMIDRCMCLHGLLADARLRAVVGGMAQLPAIPETFARLREAMARPETPVREISRIIYEDAAIAAKVLQVVNSAFFRLARRIARVDQAVSYLGFNAIRSLVMSVEVFGVWQGGNAPRGLEPQRLQQHAQRVAAAARSLCDRMSLADDALLAGLFHNIGYWVLLPDYSKQLQQAHELACTQGLAVYEAERTVIGASQAEVGAYLLGLWGLPYSVIEAVAFQDSPQVAIHTGFDALAALVVAKSLVFGSAPLASEAQQAAQVAIDDAYLKSLNAPFDAAEARHRVLHATGEMQQ
jgi:HD-like signal output (HDOD) protein